MADQTQPPADGSQAGLQVPADTQARFAAIIELIKGSESMNDEERQYWVNILPIMTDEQLTNLTEILTNEKKQLAAIDSKYDTQVAAVADKRSLAQIGEDVKKKKTARQQQESEAQKAEEAAEADVLKKIQGM